MKWLRLLSSCHDFSQPVPAAISLETPASVCLHSPFSSLHAALSYSFNTNKVSNIVSVLRLGSRGRAAGGFEGRVVHERAKVLGTPICCLVDDGRRRFNAHDNLDGGQVNLKVRDKFPTKLLSQESSDLPYREMTYLGG